MRLNRRRFVSDMGASSLLTLELTFGGLSPARAAVAFPTKDINFIIPAAPGGGFDAYVRAVIPAMEARFNGTVRVIPQNVDGAGGAKAAGQLYRARADGYTVSLLNVPGILILQQQGGGALGFDLERLTWICTMGSDPYALIVPKDSPIKSIADLRTLSRSRAVKFPCPGPASTAYSATRIASSLLGIKEQIIAGYKGTNDYIVAALRGDGDAAIASITALAQFRASGLIRVLASFENRSTIAGVEDATTLKLPELTQIVQLRPVAGPPNLPADIVDALARSIMGAMKDPKVVAWAAAAGANLDDKGPQQTLLALRQQKQFIERWKAVLTPV
jgi:tripartite-type tricarboxylate transporter receptor subunit TctC